MMENFSNNTKGAMAGEVAGQNFYKGYFSKNASFFFIISVFFLVFLGQAAFASHFSGGQVTYKYLGEGRYEFLIKGYWDKDYVGNVFLRYEGSPKIHGFPVSISKTLLSDGKTVEHVQKQEVSWSKPGLYKAYWGTCCREEGANFYNNNIELFAYVNYDPAVPSSSPQIYDGYDPTNFSFEAGRLMEYKMHMEDPEGHEQEYSLTIPYGLAPDAYEVLLETGFQLKQDGSMLWENPVVGTWLVNVRIREKIDGYFTGAYIDREFLIKVECAQMNVQYSIVAQPCPGSNNGKISLSTSADFGHYTYSLDSGVTYQSQAVFENLAAGDYTAMIKDTNGCSAEPLLITLTEASLPEVTLSLPAEFCMNAGATALTNGSPSGGYYEGLAVENGFFYPEEAGIGTHTIYYTFTDSNGCSNTASQEIVVNEPPVADAGPDAVVYTQSNNNTHGNGNGNGKGKDGGNGNNGVNGNGGGNGNGGKRCTNLTAEATAGTAPYTYHWSTEETTQTIKVCPAETTTYVLTVTDAAGCSDTSQVTVSVEANGNARNSDTKSLNSGRETSQDAENAKEDMNKEKGSHLNAKNVDLEINNSLFTEVKVFPNPLTAESQLTVRLEEADRINIDIIDLSGRVVKELYAGNIEANQELSFKINSKLGEQPIYLARLMTTKGVYTIKLLQK